MKIAREQFERISPYLSRQSGNAAFFPGLAGRTAYLPRQRGNAGMNHLQLVNAILYVTENGCQWRALPESYGKRHTVYVRVNRWSKRGVLQRLFAALRQDGLIPIGVESLGLDSASVKVHPDGCGALKNRETVHRPAARRTYSQNSYGHRV